MRLGFYIFVLFFSFSGKTLAQKSIKGKVVNMKDGLPVKGALIKINDNDEKQYISDQNGHFSINVSGETFIIEVNHMAYESFSAEYGTDTTFSMNIKLREKAQSLESVDVYVSTGYQKIPKERATGSFSFIDRRLLNQQVGSDLLSRLEVTSNGLSIDNSTLSSNLMVRGLSTVRGPRSPLIVVDNFPYEGDINNINPNDVESVTVLKDASAASIWGARAANGVIVITTRKPLYGSPLNIEFNTNVRLGSRANLNNIEHLSNSDFIEMEKELFDKGFYDSQLSSPAKPVVSPVVEILEKIRTGSINKSMADAEIERLKGIDLKEQLYRHMYKSSLNQEYFVSISGGNENSTNKFTVGYDRDKESLGNMNNQLRFSFNNTFRISEKIQSGINFYYTKTSDRSGRSGYSDLSMKDGRVVPYLEIASEEGAPLAVPRDWRQSYIETIGDGLLLDWNYYPLLDWKHNKAKRQGSSIISNVFLEYKIIPDLRATINYQYDKQEIKGRNLFEKQSYMARNYINGFAQLVQNDVVFNVPPGAILDRTESFMDSHNIRGQLAFDKTYNHNAINMIVGAETRMVSSGSDQDRVYGYNPDNLTIAKVDYITSFPHLISGRRQIEQNQFISSRSNNYISYYANAAYTYRSRYILSTSARRDASNLFGLGTNDQWNPFWSVGLAWKTSEEPFYNFDFLSYLSFRGTYGFSGNIDPSMVALTTISYSNSKSPFTDGSIASISNYYNPSLKWETTRTINFGLDFRIKKDIVSGFVEYYFKKGNNLFGYAPLDYTTGVPPTTLRNVGEMKSGGLDIQIKSQNLKRTKLKWSTFLNFSLNKERLVDYYITRTLASQYVIPNDVPVSAVKNKPVYNLFAYRWAGLDPESGQPRGILEEEVSMDYRSLMGAETELSDLKSFGSALPTRFGSMINDFRFGNIGLQVGLNFKFGYWFRRGSIHYTNLFNSWVGHSDYGERWSQPGDEQFTNVPANDFITDSNRDNFYLGSEVLVEKADHIRLQYINFIYDMKTPSNWGLNSNKISLFLNISNLGVLWKANKQGIDPDYYSPTGLKLEPSTIYSIGVRTSL